MSQSARRPPPLLGRRHCSRRAQQPRHPVHTTRTAAAAPFHSIPQRIKQISLLHSCAMSHHSPTEGPSFISHSHSLHSSSDEECQEQNVVTLRPEAILPCSGARSTPVLHAAHDLHNKQQISFKTVGKISVELMRRSRRARLTILHRLLQDKLDDLEVAAVVCAHLHDRWHVLRFAPQSMFNLTNHVGIRRTRSSFCWRATMQRAAECSLS